MGGHACKRVLIQAATQPWSQHVIVIAGRHRRQFPERDVAGVPQVRQPVRDRIVQRYRALVNQPQQQRRHVGDGHPAVAKVHLDGGGHARHRGPVGARQNRLAADRHLRDHGMEIVGSDRRADHPIDARPGTGPRGCRTGGVGDRARPARRAAARQSDRHRGRAPANGADGAPRHRHPSGGRPGPAEPRIRCCAGSLTLSGSPDDGSVTAESTSADGPGW
jgi:hypothetical protein